MFSILITKEYVKRKMPAPLLRIETSGSTLCEKKTFSGLFDTQISNLQPK